MERTVTAVDLIGRFYLATNENDVLNAACLLRNESEANLVPTLIAALQDHWEPRRFGAALALCFKTDRRILRPLIDVVGDARHSSRTRCMAAESLGYLGRRKAIPCLLDGSRDTSSDLRFWSVFALGKFLDRRRCGRTVEQALEARLGDHEELEGYLQGYWSVSLEALAMLGSRGSCYRRYRLPDVKGYESRMRQQLDRIEADANATKSERNWFECYRS